MTEISEHCIVADVFLDSRGSKIYPNNNLKRHNQRTSYGACRKMVCRYQGELRDEAEKTNDLIVG